MFKSRYLSCHRLATNTAMKQQKLPQLQHRLPTAGRRQHRLPTAGRRHNYKKNIDKRIWNQTLLKCENHTIQCRYHTHVSNGLTFGPPCSVWNLSTAAADSGRHNNDEITTCFLNPAVTTNSTAWGTASIPDHCALERHRFTVSKLNHVQ